MNQRILSVSQDQASNVRDRQDAVRTLLDRAEHLSPPDRALLRSVYAAGLTANELAVATNRAPHSIRRRLRRVVRRMQSDPFLFVLRHERAWPSTRRKVGRAVVLRGQTLRSAAESLGVSFHAVRVELDRIRTLCEAQGLGVRD